VTGAVRIDGRGCRAVGRSRCEAALDLGRPALRRKLPVSGMERSHLAIERMERRLTVILAADVAGYSRLMGSDEEGTLARLKAHRRALVDPKISEHRGRIVKTTGDGMLVEFVSVVDAVRCAVDIQRGMVERNASVPADRRIEFRIGINVGDIIVEDQDVFGDGVNVAARLEGLADPGAICVSEVKAVLRAITKLWRIRERLVVSSSVRTSAK
jgi:class 3 adenylate cyclase